MTSHKSGVLALLAAVFALSLSACQDGSATDTAFSSERGAGGEELDLGQDWAETASTELSSATDAGRAPSCWTVLLGTYTGPGHENAAANMVRSCASIDPRLGSARVHTTSKGSMVVFGAHDDPSSAAAQQDLKWVKEIQLAGRQVFPRAMLTRINLRAARGELRPNELLSVRKLYPRVNPLYTLEVAIWGDFGSGTQLKEIQQSAEAYARELRGQGYEAYFHHDDDRRLSMVTVGVFDRTAIDAQSGIYAPEVEVLMRKFPARLVNGEPLNEPVNPRLLKLGTRVQRPKLVLVPEL